MDEARLTPPAPVTAPQAAEAIRACYGLTGELARLPGEADDNFLLRPSGGQRYVVKVGHPRADPRVVGVQVRVLRHIESAAAGLPVPRVVPAAGGRPWTVVAAGPLRGRVVHVLTYLDGALLRSVRTDPALRRTLGVTLARLGRALREFDGPPVRRPLLWDLAQLPRLRPLLADRPDNRGTSLLGNLLGRFAARAAPRLAAQRTQLVHNDLSPDNMLPDLILARIAARIIISEWRAERFPENSQYVLRNTPRAWEQLHRWLHIPAGQIAARKPASTSSPKPSPEPSATSTRFLSPEPPFPGPSAPGPCPPPPSPMPHRDVLRPDLELHDVSLAFELVAAIKFADPGRTAELRHRYLALILDGMRAADRGVLPGPPPDWPELSERWNAS